MLWLSCLKPTEDCSPFWRVALHASFTGAELQFSRIVIGVHAKIASRSQTNAPWKQSLFSRYICFFSVSCSLKKRELKRLCSQGETNKAANLKIIDWAAFCYNIRPFKALYGFANDPRTANDPQIGPQMIPERKWSPYWTSTANDLDQKLGNGMDGAIVWIGNWRPWIKIFLLRPSYNYNSSHFAFFILSTKFWC